jgi:hypothetical protein
MLVPASNRARACCRSSRRTSANTLLLVLTPRSILGTEFLPLYRFACADRVSVVVQSMEHYMNVLRVRAICFNLSSLAFAPIRSLAVTSCLANAVVLLLRFTASVRLLLAARGLCSWS